LINPVNRQTDTDQQRDAGQNITSLLEVTIVGVYYINFLCQQLIAIKEKSVWSVDHYMPFL